MGRKEREGERGREEGERKGERGREEGERKGERGREEGENKYSTPKQNETKTIKQTQIMHIHTLVVVNKPFSA